MPGSAGHRSRPPVDRDDPLAGLRLDLRPGLVGALGQADVVGAVVRQADDPAVVGGGAVGVAELEALQAEDRAPGRSRPSTHGRRPDRGRARRRRRPRTFATRLIRSGRYLLIGSLSRSSATRWMATTLIASVMRPSRVIARASSNGTQRTSIASVGSGAASPWRQVGGEVQDGPLVGDRVGQVDPRDLAPRRRLEPGLLPELALRPVQRRLAGRHAALGDLPRPRVQRVAVLPDERRPVLVVEDHHARGEIREVDDAVDARAAVGSRHLVVPDGDPRVLVGDATSASGESAIHARHRRTAWARSWGRASAP